MNEYYEGMLNRNSVAYSTKPSSVGFPDYIDAQAGENYHVPVMDWAGYRADVLSSADRWMISAGRKPCRLHTSGW